MTASAPAPWRYTRRQDADGYDVVVRDFPATARIIGYVAIDPASGRCHWWTATPTFEPDRAPFGGYGRRDDAARALYEDWLAAGHTDHQRS